MPENKIFVTFQAIMSNNPIENNLEGMKMFKSKNPQFCLDPQNPMSQ